MDRKEAKRAYKLSHRPMGVFEIRNTASGQVLIDSSVNVPGKINRHTLQLNIGSHPNKQLQADWNALGAGAFQFETLEPMEPRNDIDHDNAADLSALEDLWLEKLSAKGDLVYNVKKLTRGERLKMIAANRKL